MDVVNKSADGNTAQEPRRKVTEGKDIAMD